MRRIALAGLLALAGCNRHGAADVTLDADAATRNATAAKTLDDLAAAAAASQGPPPHIAPVTHKPDTDQPTATTPDRPETADTSPSEDSADESNSAD
jgi:hypothetical protein